MKEHSMNPHTIDAQAIDLSLLPPGDVAAIEAARDEDHREAIGCAVTTYRQPDRLEIGDPVPALELTRLDAGRALALAAQRDRPLVLFFGSYT